MIAVVLQGHIYIFPKSRFFEYLETGGARPNEATSGRKKKSFSREQMIELFSVYL